MVVRFLSWLAGRVDYSVRDGTANDAARLLILSGARFRNLRRDSQGLTFSLPLSQSAVIERVFDEHGIPPSSISCPSRPDKPSTARRRSVG